MNQNTSIKGSTIERIFSIASNTFREAVRDRVLYNLVIFVLLITAAAVFLGELTAGQEARTIVNLGLGAMLLFGAFISIFVGNSLVSKEIDRRTVYAIFSKPIGRGEFILGKYLGLCLTLLVNVLVMGLGVTLALLYVGGKSLSITIWGAVLLIFLELMILIAVAILFSSFSSPALSALLSFCVFVIGHFSAALNELAATLNSTFAKFFFGAIYYLLPNLAAFTFRTEASHGSVPPTKMILFGVLYALLYSAILLIIAIAVFSRRNFK